MRLLRCELENVLRPLRRNRLLHDLTRQNVEHLERHQGAIADLRADRVGALDLEIVCLAEVLRNRDRPSLARREPQRVRTRRREPLHDARGPCLLPRRPRRDAHAHHEALQADAVGLSHAPAGRKLVRVFRVEEVQAHVNEWALLVHRAGADVDVDEHLADRRAYRLEVAAPENNAATDVLRLAVREE